VSVSYDRTLKLWISSPARDSRLEGRCHLVQTCKISPDGRRIVSGCDDGSLRLWEFASGRSLTAVVDAHVGSVLGCA